MSRLLSLLLVAWSLAGCATISALGEASQTLEVYELQTPRLGPQSGRRTNIEMVVEKPAASGALDTDRIMIRPQPLQAQYLPGVRWADPAPDMLQTLLVRSLSESGSFQSVGRRPLAAAGDFAVLSELTDFQAILLDGGDQARVEVRLMVRLVRERDARVVASRTFAATAIAPSTDPDTIVAAFDSATTDLLTALVPWLVARS